MSLIAMSVETKIPVYEMDGNTASLGQNLVLKSHWNRRDLVVIVVGDKEFTVGADALEEAARRCTRY